MAWVRLDDQLPRHPKIRELSDRAFRVYVTAMCETSEFLDDGYVSATQLRDMRATPKAVAEPVDNDLLIPSDVAAGFQIKNYLKRNPSREQVEGRRAAAAKRLRDWREEQEKKKGA